MTASLEELGRAVATLTSSGRYPEAEALVRPYVASGRALLPVWQLLVSAIRPQGKIEETRRIQEMLVDTSPGDLSARFNLAETLLLSGDFERGWREYRYRYRLAHTTRIERKVQMPRWDGEPIAGKTLLIHDEQGYGDTFQFLRMVPWARERSGARTILEIIPEQLSIAQRAGGFDEIIAKGTLPPKFDVHCEMMSLPMAMGLKLGDLPGRIPYLTADAHRLEHWRARLEGLPRPWVALCWAGRPTHFNDRARSMALTDLVPLAGPDMTFLSLQKGAKAQEAGQPPTGMRLAALGDELQDFEDTAAVLMLADLLISVDSSPVHLAGALGRPVWVMLPFVPDWRWLLDRTDSPWYPTLRLFRQPAIGDWASVTRAIAQELRALAH